MSTSDLVSVIVPCYEQGRFLRDAIESLQAQSHRNWEAIIVDDGSRDDTELVAQALRIADSRVRYLSTPNRGLSSARNLGIRHSRGSFLQFLDADDRIGPQKLQAQVECLRTSPNVGIAYGNAWYFPDGAYGRFERGPYANSPDHDWVSEAWHEPRPLIDKLLDRNIFPVCCALIRRTVVDRVGDFNEALQALEDWDYWLRCAIAGIGFLFHPFPGTEAYIRLHASSMTQDPTRMCLAGFKFRLSCMKYLGPGDARQTNFARLLKTSSELDIAGRSNRLKVIASIGLTANERLGLVTIWLFGKGGVLHPIAELADRWVLGKVKSRVKGSPLSLP